MDLLDTIVNLANQAVTNLPITLGFLGIVFAIQILNAALGYRLNLLGIWPRKSLGWIGIPFSPFLHGNFSHFFFNMVPLFIFSNLLILQGAHTFFVVTTWIIVMSGVLIWALARPGIHVGASALIMGYLGYLLIGAYYKPTALSFIIGATCFFYFGGMLINLFPNANRQVSWEGHIFGFVSGIATAILISQTGN